jgi:hypothetical protein
MGITNPLRACGSYNINLLSPEFLILFRLGLEPCCLLSGSQAFELYQLFWVSSPSPQLCEPMPHHKLLDIYESVLYLYIHITHTNTHTQPSQLWYVSGEPE